MNTLDDSYHIFHGPVILAQTHQKSSLFSHPVTLNLGHHFQTKSQISCDVSLRMVNKNMFINELSH